MELLLRAPVQSWKVPDHFEITPNQLMLNVWRLLMALECLSMKSKVDFGLGEILYSYYLKDYDKEKGRYY